MFLKKLLAVLAVLFVVLSTAVGLFFWAALEVPEFYKQVLVEEPSPEIRKKSAKEFVQRTVQLVEEINHSETNRWAEEFSQKQINGWLAEELQRKYAEAVPPGVSNPRVGLLKDRVWIGFAYEDLKRRGIVSLSLKPRVTGPNRLAVEIESIRLGLVPIPLEKIVDKVVPRLSEYGLQAEWRQANGNPVLVVQLGGLGKNEPVLEAVEVNDGVIRLAGKRVRDVFPPASPPKTNGRPRLANQSDDGDTAAN